MTSPRRLLETPGALPRQLQRALRGAPGVPQPAELADLASKVGGALSVSLTAPLVAPVHGLGSGVASKSLWPLGWWLLGGGVLGVGLSAAAAVTATAFDGPAPDSRQRAVPVAVVATTASVRAATAPLVPTALPEPVATSLLATPMGSANRSIPSSQSKSKVPAAAPEPEPVESELSLLRRAQALIATDPGQALALSAVHSRRFPNGTLSQERDIIAIDALLRLARTPEAKARARAFHERYPGSAHARRLEELLEEP